MGRLWKYQEEFVMFLANSGALFFKEGLKLKDGRPTPYFLNTGKISHGSSTIRLAEAYAGMIDGQIRDGLEINTLFGPAYKGIPLVTSIAMKLFRKNHDLDLPYVFDRKEEKTHGEGSERASLFVGNFPENARVYLVDDVLTSAKTKLKALDKIRTYSESEGRTDIAVVGVGIAFDRQQNNLEGANAIRNFTERTGVPVSSIVGAREAMKFLFESEWPLMINNSRKPMPLEIYKSFQEYMEEYGSK